MRFLAKKLFCLVIAFISCITAIGAQEFSAAAYVKRYEKNCAEAETYIADIKPRLLKMLEGDEQLTDIGIAVIFPELTRYSYWRDAMESMVLELSYVFGNDTDFSVGKMQMKPSFAEMLEADADGYSRLHFPQLFLFADLQTVRRKRIDHLKDLNDQTAYLAIFLRIMKSRFPTLLSEDETAVRIFSAAYNAGYRKNMEELQKYSRLTGFPDGKLGGNNQYSYSEIALDYYRRNKILQN